MDLESISKRNAIERHVVRLWSAIAKCCFSAQCVVRCFNVYGGNVVRKQHDLRSKKLIGVFTSHVFRLDEAGLQKPNHKRRRAGERIEDADTFIGKSFAKMHLGYVIGGAENKVDDLYRGVDNTE